MKNYTTTNKLNEVMNDLTICKQVLDKYEEKAINLNNNDTYNYFTLKTILINAMEKLEGLY